MITAIATAVEGMIAPRHISVVESSLMTYQLLILEGRSRLQKAPPHKC